MKYLLIVILLSFACGKSELDFNWEYQDPQHVRITTPEGMTLVKVECGQPCAVFHDPTTKTYFVEFAHGGSMTVFKDGSVPTELPLDAGTEQ